ncbi:MAG: hypothetical protein ACI4XS_07480 [Bacillus sp. (in: firmicutes)]
MKHKGVKNTEAREIRDILLGESRRYYERNIVCDDDVTANLLHIKKGDMVSAYMLDLSAMEPAARAAMNERILKYHTASLQNIDSSVSIKGNIEVTLEQKMKSLADDNE